MDEAQAGGVLYGMGGAAVPHVEEGSMTDLEWEMINRELQRQERFYAYIDAQLIGECRPGGIIRVPNRYSPSEVEFRARTD